MTTRLSMATAAALVLATSSALLAAKPPVTSTFVLESSSLRLEVSSAYAYKVIEKGTGTVLLNENLTTFTIGTTSYNASALSGVTVTGTTLDGTLTLNNTTTAHVQFAFVSADNLKVTLSSNKGTPVSIAERFADAGQRYYGVWENALPNSLDNRGISSAYNGKETTTTKDVFASSARAPFFLTDKNYGIYTNTQAAGTYTFAQSGNTSLKFNTPTLQYNILHGTTPKAILAQNNAVAGPAFMPPTWAFDTIFWRDDFHQLPAQNSAIKTAQDLILDDATKLQAAHIHAGAMWIDRPYGTGTGDSNVAGWGNMDFDASFPNPSTMVSTLQDEGINLMLWVANKANNTLKTEGAAKGYLFTGYSNSPAIDLSKSAAYDWFNSKLTSLDNKALLPDNVTGIKGFKLDRGGEGEMPDAVINAETTLLQKLAFQNMQAQNGADFFNFTRNVNDQGRQYAAVWSGDPKTTWLGFQTSIKNGLRSGLINFPMWGSDTGGYNGTTTQELFSRWVTFSAYCPMMEILQGPGRNIFYDFTPETLSITAQYTDLHHDLIPYTRSAMAAALQSGTPIMRPMFVEFPNVPALADNSDQYMYGPNILVAPITAARISGATTVSRSVILPALANGGHWLDYNDRKTVYAGNQTVSVAAKIDTIPTFVREGAIIPRGDIVQGNNNWSNSSSGSWQPSLRIEVFPSSAFASSFDYYTGSSITAITAVPITDGTVQGFEITSGDLLLPGAFDVYLTQPDSVWLNGQDLTADLSSLYDPVKDLLSVPFTRGALTLDIWGAQSLFDTPAGSLSFAFSTTAVPEPAGLMLLALGGTTLLVRRRKSA